MREAMNLSVLLRSFGSIMLTGSMFFAAFTFTASQAEAQAPTRCEVMAHAKQWIDNKVYYSQGPHGGYCRGSYYYDPHVGKNYRPDCSGYVSAVWRRPAPGNTTYSFAGGPWSDGSSHIINYNDLRPGDALNFAGNPNTGTGHIRLFGGWMNDAKTRVWTYETSTCGTHAYRSEYNRSDLINNGYVAIRLNGIRECEPATPPAPKPPALPAQLTGNGAITAVNWNDKDHVEVWVRSTDGALYRAWSTGGNNWSTLVRQAEGATCGFAAGFWPTEQGYPEVIMPMADGSTQSVWHKNSWQGPHDFGGDGLSEISTLAWPTGKLEVFALHDSGELHHRFWLSNTAGWSNWYSLGGDLKTGVSPITWGDGRPELFATGYDGQVRHRWWETDETGWSDWSVFPGSKIASRPVPVRWDDGSVEIFARGEDGLLHHAWIESGSGWNPLRPLHSVKNTRIQGEPSAIVNPRGNGGPVGAQVFVRDMNNRLLEVHMDTSGWTEFRTMPANLSGRELSSDPFAWIRGDGVALLFAVDANGKFIRSHRDPATGWQPWTEIGGATLDPCVATPQPGSPAPGSNEPDPVADPGSNDPGANEPAPDSNEPDPDSNEPDPVANPGSNDPNSNDPGSNAPGSNPTITSTGCSATDGPVPGMPLLLIALGLLTLRFLAPSRSLQRE